MGMYTFKCKECDFEDIEIMSYDKIDAFVSSTSCSCGGDIYRQILAPNISSRNHDTTGVHNTRGYFSQAFGRYFHNQYAMYEYAEQNGYKRVTAEEADEAMFAQAGRLQAQDDFNQTYVDNLKAAGGDKIQAAAKTFVPKHMQDK